MEEEGADDPACADEDGEGSLQDDGAHGGEGSAGGSPRHRVTWRAAGADAAEQGPAEGAGAADMQDPHLLAAAREAVLDAGSLPVFARHLVKRLPPSVRTVEGHLR